MSYPFTIAIAHTNSFGRAEEPRKHAPHSQGGKTGDFALLPFLGDTGQRELMESAGELTRKLFTRERLGA